MSQSFDQSIGKTVRVGLDRWGRLGLIFVPPRTRCRRSFARLGFAAMRSAIVRRRVSVIWQGVVRSRCWVQCWRRLWST